MTAMLAWMIPAALAAVPADASKSVGKFRVGTVVLAAAIPDGFCLPDSETAAVAQLVAAGDRGNVTHLTINHCDEAQRWTAYFLVKTPTEALMVTTTNAEFQKVVEPILTKGFNSEEIAASASKDVSATLQSKIDLKGQIRFLGKDETCLYLGGVFDVTGASGSSYTLAMAQCMTVVEGKVLSVYRYGEGKDSKAVEALQPSAKAFAKGIRRASAQ